MTDYKFVIHGNEVPLKDIEIAEVQIRDSSHPFSIIAEEYIHTYDYLLNEVISKIISNNLQI